MLASVYALRLFIRAMHNRVGPKVESREISFRDGVVLVPLLAVILFMALYPQLALHRSEGSVKAAVAPAHAALEPSSTRLAGGLGRQRCDGRSTGGTPRRRSDADERAPPLATAHLKGPHVDFAGLSPLIALLGGATIVLLVGLIRARWVRAQRRARAQPASRSARRPG